MFLQKKKVLQVRNDMKVKLTFLDELFITFFHFLCKCNIFSPYKYFYISSVFSELLVSVLSFVIRRLSVLVSGLDSSHIMVPVSMHNLPTLIWKKARCWKLALNLYLERCLHACLIFYLWGTQKTWRVPFYSIRDSWDGYACLIEFFVQWSTSELFGVQKGLCFLLPVRRSYSYVAVSVAWQDVERLHVLQNVFLSCF